MKKFLSGFLVLCTLGVASADIRLFNATSEDIVVDVLSKHGQERDVLIPARTFSPVLGAKRVPARTKEMVVYKTKDGNEISRDEYWSGSAYMFKYHSTDSFRRDEVFNFDKSENRNDLIHFINNTGSRMDTSYETPDFELEESFVYGPDANAYGATEKNVATYSYLNILEENGSREITFTAPIFDGPQKQNLTAGHVYLLEADNGALKATQVFP